MLAALVKLEMEWKLSWRALECYVGQLTCLPQVATSEQIHAKFTPILINMITKNVSELNTYDVTDHARMRVCGVFQRLPAVDTYSFFVVTYVPVFVMKPDMSWYNTAFVAVKLLPQPHTHENL